jgi:hypothetical protein
MRRQSAVGFDMVPLQNAHRAALCMIEWVIVGLIERVIAFVLLPACRSSRGPCAMASNLTSMLHAVFAKTLLNSIVGEICERRMLLAQIRPTNLRSGL